MFWLSLSFFLLIVCILEQTGRFTYYPYFDDQGRFWVRKALIFKEEINLNEIIQTTITLRNARGYNRDPASVIIFHSNDNEYIVGTTGIFCYRYNIELLKRVKNTYPHITFSESVIKYINSENQKGFYMVDQHIFGYTMISLTSLFFLYQFLQ